MFCVGKRVHVETVIGKHGLIGGVGNTIDSENI